MDADIIVIGGGIVGLSTAMQLLEKFPDISVIVLEKEDQIAQHQTSHNSGVIHAGVYYKPGSFKAKFCKAGVEASIDFCQKHNIPYEQCGKLIVATDDVEVERLKDLYNRCLDNGLSPEMLDQQELQQREPNIIGQSAIFVSSSGITDYPGIAQAMARQITALGGKILTGHAVTNMVEESDQVIVETNKGSLRASNAIVCAGLMSDRLARMCGIDLNFRIIPFRGEYYKLPESKNNIVKHLIYPVPDPALPFLGVHLTKMIGGYTTVGPNAVLAFGREGYSWGEINLRDLGGMMSFPGFWRVLGKHARSGATEFKNSIFKKGYLELCRKYCPELTIEDLQPYPAGVRAQAVKSDGTLIHDFLIERTKRTLHVCNAPSPAATSSLPIGNYLVEEASKTFEYA